MATYRVTMESVHVNVYEVEAESLEEATVLAEDIEGEGVLIDSYGDGGERVVYVRELNT